MRNIVNKVINLVMSMMIVLLSSTIIGYLNSDKGITPLMELLKKSYIKIILMALCLELIVFSIQRVKATWRTKELSIRMSTYLWALIVSVVIGILKS